MTIPDQSSVRNRLLSLMTADDFARLAPDLEPVQMPQGAVLALPDTPMDYAYFLESGVGSVIAVSAEGNEVEAGLFGRESVAPTDLLLGADRASHRVVIQIEDDAFRIAKAPFLAAVQASEPLRTLLLRYVQTFLVQASFTALSNAVHPVDERLARWILMCDDRMDGRDMQLTHKFLSIMLAVRRSSVTTSLHVLEGNGFIRSLRGCIVVRDRAGLESFAGDAYGKAEASHRELLGPLR